MYHSLFVKDYNLFEILYSLYFGGICYNYVVSVLELGFAKQTIMITALKLDTHIH